MQVQFSFYILPLLVAALMSGWVAYYAWTHRRDSASAFALFLLGVALTEWLLAYALEIAGTNLATKLLGAKSQYIGIAGAPFIWLMFAIQHNGQGKRLTPLNTALLGAIPAVTILLAFTTDIHGLIWKTFEIKTTDNFSALGVSYGVWFWVHSVYSYLLLLGGSIIILRSVGRRQGLYRGQTALLITGVAAPWLGNILYLSGLSPIPYLDLTPFTFTITILAFTWAIFGFRLIDLSPIARDIIVEGMQEGMIVLDTRNDIVDINLAARRMIGVAPETEVIGQSAGKVFARWPDLVERYRETPELQTELTLGEGTSILRFDLRISPLLDQKNRPLGRVVILRNETGRVRTEDLKQAFLDDMRALQDLHLALTEIKELDQLYVRMIQLAQQRLGLDRVGLFLLDEKSNQLKGTFGVDQLGQVRDERYYMEPITPEHWTLEILNAPNRAILWPEAPLFDNGEVVGTGWKAATTLWNGQNAVGYLVCDNLYKRKPARAYESELISIIGSTFGHLIERKRTDYQLIQRVSQLSAIDQLGREMVSTLNVEQVYAAAHRAVATLMEMDVFYIALLDEQREEIQDAYMFDSGKLWPNERRPLAEQGLSASVIKSGKPLWVEDDLAGQVTLAEGRVLFGVPEETRSVIIIPLNNKGQVMGVMSVQHYQPFMYTSEHLDMFILLGNQVAVAIENARLVESLQLQAAALDAAANAIVITDRTGTIQWVNHAFTTLTGYSYEEAVGNTTHLLNSNHHEAAFFKRLWETVLAGKIWEGQVVNRRKDGALYIEQQTITPLRNQEGEIHRFIAIKQDISELIRARDQALEANRLKSQLLAKVSHELRTPLGGILGYAELLHHDMMGALDEKQKQATSQIIDSTHYLNTMVNELLDEAQIESRTIILQKARFSPAAILKRVEATMTVLAQKKGLSLTIQSDPNLPAWIYGDEYRLHQIMINLTVNAIKFTTSGEVCLQVHQPDPSQWTIQVKDTGIGIPVEALSYIFEPFRQINSAITRENRGTGLGLTITKQLVELMGGHITIESEVGKGSTFTVWLPLVTELEKTI